MMQKNRLCSTLCKNFILFIQEKRSRKAFLLLLQGGFILNIYYIEYSLSTISA